MAHSKRNFTSTSVERSLLGILPVGSTTLTLDTDIGLAGLAFPFTLVVDPDISGKEEIVTVLSRGSGYSFTVVRGSNGTAEVDHVISAKVRHMLTARDLQESQDHIDASSAYVILNPNSDSAIVTSTITLPVHGIGVGQGDVVGTLKTQTLTNKTLTSPTITGVPLAPTATVGTNTTQIATTAFVLKNSATGGVSEFLLMGA